MSQAALPTKLTLAEARETLESLTAALADAPAAAIDASALEVFDTSALAVLLECRRIALVAGKPFEVHGTPTLLAELAGLYDVDELLFGVSVPGGLVSAGAA